MKKYLKLLTHDRVLNSISGPTIILMFFIPMITIGVLSLDFPTTFINNLDMERITTDEKRVRDVSEVLDECEKVEKEVNGIYKLLLKSKSNE